MNAQDQKDAQSTCWLWTTIHMWVMKNRPYVRLWLNFIYPALDKYLLAGYCVSGVNELETSFCYYHFPQCKKAPSQNSHITVDVFTYFRKSWAIIQMHVTQNTAGTLGCVINFSATQLGQHRFNIKQIDYYPLCLIIIRWTRLPSTAPTPIKL